MEIFAVVLALVEEMCVMAHEHSAQIVEVEFLVLPMSIAAFVGLDLQEILLHFVVLAAPEILIVVLVAVGPFVVFGASFVSFGHLFSIFQ